MHCQPNGGTAPRSRPEVWGGVECTVNRVGDRYFDQLERTGHAWRMNDLDLFAGLGLRTLRYPMLWERVAPDGVDRADWSWVETRIRRMQQLGIRPIASLVHHGSGPRDTSLLDPAFPEKLAAYAGAFAARFPEIAMYTPVNEPLTTARFSGLYGLWYPHGHEANTFASALLIQLRATVLAMAAIREVNPAAQLVQTEDLGKVFSTPELAYQADFENDRRWLTFDLLSGRSLSAGMTGYFRESGIDASALQWFVDHPAPPDILGINHYVTSERFLDHRFERYPAVFHGGNGRQRYADIEATRVMAKGPAGAPAILGEAWDRYRRPLAVTEVHLGSTREEQLRWLIEVWDAAVSLCGRGVDVRAVTTWALLGAYDWQSLLTRVDGHYECGAFDVRGSAPRPTAVAHTVRELTNGSEPAHPVLARPGWWRRDERLLYPPFPDSHPHHGGRFSSHSQARPQPVLITGATGTLGRAFARVCEARAIDYRLTSRHDMDIADAASVSAAMTEARPWAVINAAGFVRVDDAEWEEERCHRENAEGPAVLAAACAARGIELVTFSSDLVFDGTHRIPYTESDPVSPINAYGRSKALGEARVLRAMPSALVVRTSAFFGPWDEYNMLTQGLRALADGDAFVAATDATVSPTYVPDLVNVTLDLMIDRASGIWHLTNDGVVNWHDLVKRAADLAEVDSSRLEGRPLEEMALAAPRPLYTPLRSARARMLPSLDDALGRFVRERTVQSAEQVAA